MIRDRDWTATPLGEANGWPQSLKTIVQMMMGSRYAMWMGWGPKLTFFYNDAYRPTLGIKHPHALGTPVNEVWAEIWDDVRGRIESVLSTGVATLDNGLLLLLERSGYPEETYHTFSYSPLNDDTGRIAGLFCVVTEETERVIGERRMGLLRELGTELAGQHTETELGAAVQRVLGSNLKDLPFTLTYLSQENRGAKLLCATGIGRDHPVVRPALDPGQGPWPIDRLSAQTRRVHMKDLSALGALPAGDWQQAPREAMLVSIPAQGGGTPAGVLIVGLNPHRPFDTAYSDFLDLLAGQLGGALANLQAYEEARTLEVLNRIGAAVAGELDLERAVQVVTDAATELTGAAFGAFFYNVIDNAGGKYTLYTISGVPREAFANFPMPRNTAIFAPTFAGLGVMRSADITKDPRYGHNDPHHGMPKGHLPVRSYLAMPVVSRTGEVLGGLFFGHPDAGVFSDRAERLLSGIASQASVAIDNARLYQTSRQAQRELAELNDVLEKRVAERSSELVQSERQLRLLVAGVTDYALYMLDTGGVIATWNAGAQRIKGYDAEEIIGTHFSKFYTEEDRLADLPGRGLATARLTGKFEAEGWRLRKDGSRFWANVVIDAIYDDAGALVGFAKITRDMTERRMVEEQLRQAQKMEAIGQLTGGVAHDFNNLLIIILGNIETLQRQLDKGNLDAVRLRRVADNALRGAQRAASLTQRLLAFSRRQPLEPRPINVNRLVSNMSEILHRTLGEQIAVETVLAAGLWQTHADPNQLESAILNLAVNARDAMPDGGKLTIETANAHLDQRYADKQIEVTPGQYVVLAITDNGGGMSKDVLARVFEPFFTTKDVGHGTGLGLSQVYGFVKQSGGHVKVYSEPGQGTTVRLYLPRLLAEQDESVAAPAADARLDTGSETLLVVEDDDDVRAHSTQILTELGYRVFDAPNGQAALEILDRQSDVKLLFTDVGLPGGMNGRQLAEEVRRRRPEVQVLFTTGYARNAIVHDGRLDPGVHLITKPFTFATLSRKVRELLEAQAGPRCVLVVEDEALVRMVAVDALQELGYRVEEAGSATEAINKIRVAGARIDAAVIDVGLPDRRGDALAAELRALFSNLPIVIASGYTESALRERLGKDSRLKFLNKPYDMRQLGEALLSLGLRPPQNPDPDSNANSNS